MNWGPTRLRAGVARLQALARLLKVFVVRDLREQYAGTLLGGVWALLQPALLVAIYWWVFGVVWSLKVPALRPGGGEFSFVVFLLSGLLPWLAFQDAVNKSATAVLSRADVLRHGNFPVAVFPLARGVAAHVIFAIMLLLFVFTARSAVLQQHPLMLPTLFALFSLQLAAALGIGLVLAALTVYVRDIPHLLGMGLMGILFTAPILYPLSQVPEAMRALIWFNPYTPFAVGYQSLLLEGALPDITVWSYALVQAVGFWAFGAYVFHRLRPGFADVV